MSTQRLTISIELSAADTLSCSGSTTLVDADESIQIEGACVTGFVDCLDDNPVSIPFAGLASAGAHVVELEAEGGKVRVRYTSTDGANQAVPCDPRAFVESQSVPITALDVTRVAGGATPRVRYTLAKLAS